MDTVSPSQEEVLPDIETLVLELLALPDSVVLEGLDPKLALAEGLRLLAAARVTARRVESP